MLQRTPDGVVVEVRDDGVGGADASAGSGLSGIADRVAALDGELRVESPPGGGHGAARRRSRVRTASAAATAAPRRAVGRSRPEYPLVTP